MCIFIKWISEFDIFIINIKIYLWSYLCYEIGEYFIHEYFIFMHEKLHWYIVIVKKKWRKYVQLIFSIFGYAPRVRIDKESKCERRIEIV